MKSPQIEQLLARHPDILWEYRENIPVDSIDRKRSHGNQVRVGGNPILEETVDKYVLALKSGNEFPALIGYYDGDDIVLADGNQRLEAYIKTKKTTTDMYVILTEDPLERVLISYESNPSLCGTDASLEDNIAHARNLVKQHGFKILDASRMFHVSPSRIAEGIANFDGQSRAKDLGVQSEWVKIENKKVRVRIHNGIKLDRVFVLVVKYVANFKTGPQELTKIIDRIMAYSSEDDQLDCIRGIISAADRAKKEAQANKKKNWDKAHFSNPTGVLDGHLAYWAKVDNLATVKAMTTDERTQMRPKVAEAIRALQKIQSEIGI